MKFLKFLLTLIAGIALMICLVGWLNPSIGYGHSISVDRPVEVAWQTTMDESKYDQWLAGFQRIDLISGQKGEVGSTYRVEVRPSPEEPEFIMTETIVSKKENDHITMHFDSDFMVFEQTIHFAEEDGMTKVTTESKASGKGLMTRAMFAMMESLASSFTKQETENIEALKRVIENS